jgi:diguanylate cyclase (GGDEF)-like protein
MKYMIGSRTEPATAPTATAGLLMKSEDTPHAGGAVEMDSAQARGTYRFSVVAHHIYLFSAVGHFLFVILFLALGVPPLAVYNVGSTILFLLGMRLNRRGRHCVSFAIAGVEVFVHSALCAGLIGWESGCHYFIIGIIPFTMLLPGFGGMAKAAISVGILGSYGIVYFVTASAPAVFDLGQRTLSILNFVNLGTALGAFSLLVHYLSTASIRAEARVQTLSRTDQLTGLLNRRGMEDHLAAARSTYERTGVPYGAILGDLDHFKRINDRYGHGCGDRLLTEVAATLSRCLRSQDVVCRWGGEEFLILLPGTESEGVARVAEKLLAAIREVRVPCDAREVVITITLGGAVAQPGIDDARLVSAADGALYEGKQAGRDRFVLSELPAAP